jgi:hypothetical protein
VILEAVGGGIVSSYSNRQIGTSRLVVRYEEAIHIVARGRVKAHCRSIVDRNVFYHIVLVDITLKKTRRAFLSFVEPESQVVSRFD